MDFGSAMALVESALTGSMLVDRSSNVGSLSCEEFRQDKVVILAEWYVIKRLRLFSYRCINHVPIGVQRGERRQRCQSRPVRAVRRILFETPCLGEKVQKLGRLTVWNKSAGLLALASVSSSFM
jgi:hypothetical protein